MATRSEWANFLAHSTGICRYLQGDMAHVADVGGTLFTTCPGNVIIPAINITALGTAKNNGALGILGHPPQ